MALDDLPSDWAQLSELLEDCRHNFVAVLRPEEAEEFKYLRYETVQSWGSVFGNKAISFGEFKDESARIWVPDEQLGFVEGEVVEKEEESSLVIVKREETYSGLFCITVNPWRWLPIYSPRIILLYKGQTLNSMPPHIYAIADSVYNNMMEGDEDQSILITGESGAGKTENTKKIIQYFTVVAAHKYESHGITLEEQICESNPVLEAFGNAKSAHNDNSSRFGKFIKLWFGPNGKVSGAVIDSYLLEKSRLAFQAPDERSYHIFYQMLSSGMPDDMREDLYLRGDAKEYKYLENGMAHIEDVDDAEQFEVTQRGLSILRFSDQERLSVFKMTAASLLMGQIGFRTKHKNEEEVSVDSIIESEQVCSLLGVDTLSFLESLIEPTVEVRGEIVKQSTNLDQVLFSVSALAKAVYEKQFRWLVKRCNSTMTRRDKRLGKHWHFIGILDIAGFEIFNLNSFEQLCINYTNEKLQYFFNHQMFVREQDEYRLEGLKWKMIDFALDLEPTINLIEKPMGVLSILEEECIMPKATDMTFLDKMSELHLNKSPSYAMPKGGPKMNAHFSIKHYAGVVNYNIKNWINKNKDPLNACVVKLFKRSKEPLLKEIWNYYGTTGFKTDDPTAQTSKKTGKENKAFLTLSAVYKEQLNHLLSVLNMTHPHFVRCVVPNYDRRPGLIDGPLVINQLRCNGVLEGLRIVARGFPNRLLYEDFRDRFRILSAERADWQFEGQMASKNICEDVGLHMETEFDLGMTKIFFRVGVLGHLELMRTAKLNQVIVQLQAQIRSYIAYQQWRIHQRNAESAEIIQLNVRSWLEFKTWRWLLLFRMVKPAVRNSVQLMQREMDTLSEENDDLKKRLEEALNHLEQMKVEHEANSHERVEELRQSKDEEIERLKAELEQFVKPVVAEQSTETVETFEVTADADLTLAELLEKKQEMETPAFEFELDAEEESPEVEIGEDGVARPKEQHEHKPKELSHKELAKMSENIDQMNKKQLKKLNEGLVSSSNKLEKDVTELKEKITDDARKTEQKERTISKHQEVTDKLEDKIREVQDKLGAEANEIRKRDKKLLSLKRDFDESERAKSNKQAQMSIEIDELKTKIESLNKIIESQTEQLKESKNTTNKLRIDNRELQIKTQTFKTHLVDEKATSRKLERNLDEIHEDSINTKRRIDDVTKKFQNQVRENVYKDKEISKLKDEIDRVTILHDDALRDVKERHSASLNQVQEKTETLHKKTIKLESENQQLKAQIFAAPTEEFRRSSLTLPRNLSYGRQTSSLSSPSSEQGPGSLAMRRSSYGRLSTDSDTAAAQVEELERQKLELIHDKRVMRREIDTCNEALEHSEKHRETLSAELRTAQQEIIRLKRFRLAENEEKKQLVKELRETSHGIVHIEQKAAELIIQKGHAADSERMQALLKKSEVTHEGEHVTHRLAGMEKVCDSLQEELEVYRRRMSDAQQTIETLEAKLRESRRSSTNSNSTTTDRKTSYED